MIITQLKAFLLVFFSLIIATHSISQNAHPVVYKIDWKKEKFVLASTVIMGGSYLLLDNPTITADQISLLNPMDVNGFDRSAIYNSSQSAADVSDIFRNFINVVPFVLLLNEDCKQQVGALSVMMIESAALTGAATFMAKNLFKRKRPFVYNSDIPTADKLKHNSKQSFFSGHTAHVSAISFFTAKVLTDINPDINLKPVIWGSAAAIPAITAYLRVKAGRHFPTDVMVGYAVGAAIGYFIPELHKVKNENLHIGVTPRSQGATLDLSLRF